jgi:3-dehydroquinate dehydratase
MKVLVVHGAGMDMRGLVDVERFGPLTLPEYEEKIRGYADSLGIDVEFFHSNCEGNVIDKICMLFSIPPLSDNAEGDCIIQVDIETNSSTREILTLSLADRNGVY